MDIVLFGPPNRSSTTMKEILLSMALGLSTLGLFYAFRLHKRSQQDIQKMICDMTELSKAEETLKDLQEKFVSKGGQPFEDLKSGLVFQKHFYIILVTKTYQDFYLKGK